MFRYKIHVKYMFYNNQYNKKKYICIDNLMSNNNTLLK